MASGAQRRTAFRADVRGAGRLALKRLPYCVAPAC
jgi:hypothetical protein